MTSEKSRKIVENKPDTDEVEEPETQDETIDDVAEGVTGIGLRSMSREKRIIYRKLKKISAKAMCFIALGLALGILLPGLVMGYANPRDPTEPSEIPNDPAPPVDLNGDVWTDIPEKTESSVTPISGHSSNSYHV